MSDDDLFSQCPSGCVCGVRELVSRAQENGVRAAKDVDAAEMRALLTAVRSGYEAIRADPRLPERRQEAEAAWARADRELDVMNTMLREGQLGQAASRVRDAEQEAREGKRRPVWIRRVRWPVIMGVGLFDVYYFNVVFRYLTSQTGDAANAPGLFVRALEWFAALMPGVVLAITIAASGELLLSPLRAWQSAAQADKTDKRVRWILRVGWWLLPFCFVLLILRVVSQWAGLRALYTRPPSSGYPMGAVMLLILMLSVGAMMLKAYSSDAPAEKLAAAKRELWWRRRIYLWRTRRAGKLISAYDLAWSNLSTLRDDLVGLLRIKMLSAWEGFILRVRSLHRMTGNVTAHVSNGSMKGGVIEPEFKDIPQPQMELASLIRVCSLLDDCIPANLRERKREMDAEYARQLTQPPWREPRQPPALPPGPP